MSRHVLSHLDLILMYDMSRRLDIILMHNMSRRLARAMVHIRRDVFDRIIPHRQRMFRVFTLPSPGSPGSTRTRAARQKTREN
eukprot:5285190-Pyramimonas_sp.AAC.1